MWQKVIPVKDVKGKNNFKLLISNFKSICNYLNFKALEIKIV